jgi:hypothetical protein
MRCFIIAAVAALAFGGASDALASAAGGGGGDKALHAVHADSSSPPLFSRQHAADRRCKTPK